MLKKILTSASIITIGSMSFAQARPSIKDLTSSKTAQSVSASLPSTPRIPGQLQEHSFGIGIGQTFLNWDFSDNGQDAITVDAFYNYSASHSFDFFANFHYSSHKSRGRKLSLLGAAGSLKMKAFQFDAFTPYGLAGLGFYLPSATRVIEGSLVKSDTKLVFGINLGVGFDLALNNRYSVGALVQYHDPFDVNQEYQADVEGAYTKLLMTAFYRY